MLGLALNVGIIFLYGLVCVWIGMQTGRRAERIERRLRER